MLGLSEQAKRCLEALGVMSLLCLGLLFFRTVSTNSLRYWFIPENLALAWLGLATSWLLVKELNNRRWLSWQNLGLTFIWLFCLPNTWYVITDFIHISGTGEISELFDIVLISTLSMTGFVLGFISLWLVHRQLLKRHNPANAYWIIELIILSSSFAIYLGRVLRWNSWNVLTNPGGLIINISDRVIDPLGHMNAISFTGLFFVLITGLYFAFYKGLQSVTSQSDS